MEDFISKICGCSFGDNGNLCSFIVKLEDIIDCRNNCVEFNLIEFDLVILGMI